MLSDILTNVTAGSAARKVPSPGGQTDGEQAWRDPRSVQQGAKGTATEEKPKQHTKSRSGAAASGASDAPGVPRLSLRERMAMLKKAS